MIFLGRAAVGVLRSEARTVAMACSRLEISLTRVATNMTQKSSKVERGLRGRQHRGRAKGVEMEQGRKRAKGKEQRRIDKGGRELRSGDEKLKEKRKVGKGWKSQRGGKKSRRRGKRRVARAEQREMLYKIIFCCDTA